LVVDDHKEIRDLVGMVLSDEGYEVVTAPDGAVALKRCAEYPPSVVLLDMQMPVMDGWEFARRYRQTPGPHAPIVVMTAAQDARHRAAQIGADGYLAKPFDLDDLVRCVERFTAGKAA
jgi:CheY-like chemotaxis protein